MDWYHRVMNETTPTPTSSSWEERKVKLETEVAHFSSYMENFKNTTQPVIDATRLYELCDRTNRDILAKFAGCSGSALKAETIQKTIEKVLMNWKNDQLGQLMEYHNLSGTSGTKEQMVLTVGQHLEIFQKKKPVPDLNNLQPSPIVAPKPDNLAKPSTPESQRKKAKREKTDDKNKPVDLQKLLKKLPEVCTSKSKLDARFIKSMGKIGLWKAQKVTEASEEKAREIIRRASALNQAMLQEIEDKYNSKIREINNEAIIVKNHLETWREKQSQKMREQEKSILQLGVHRLENEVSSLQKSLKQKESELATKRAELNNFSSSDYFHPAPLIQF